MLYRFHVKFILEKNVCLNCGIIQYGWSHTPVNAERKFQSNLTHNVYSYYVLCSFLGEIITRNPSGEISIVERSWLCEVRS